MSIDAKPNLIYNVVLTSKKLIPVIISVMPMIFALICGCFKEMFCFFNVLFFLQKIIIKDICQKDLNHFLIIIKK